MVKQTCLLNVFRQVAVGEFLFIVTVGHGVFAWDMDCVQYSLHLSMLLIDITSWMMMSGNWIGISIVDLVIIYSR